MIARRNFSACEWSRSASPLKKISIYRVTADCRRAMKLRGMTTPKSFHDVTTPTKYLDGLIISNLLRIARFTKYFSTLLFPLSRYVTGCLLMDQKLLCHSARVISHIGIITELEIHRCSLLLDRVAYFRETKPLNSPMNLL